ncbi:hypothetical protein [uncultured Proteiniphilum sp.]|uniref:hypothetical protein n=1 Tax=uncultured Proteiniphilum sp. TaxID=497637 RepID=UPI00263A2823|nr:hypothetical protein [uncultured Proteiniphilum sp.]
MKSYLRCNHCNHLNEITSEYMVFCAACGKRMSNNFTEWKQRNAGKTLEDYKQSVGVVEEQIVSASSAKKRKNILRSRPLKEKIVIVVITALSASFGGWAGSSAVKAIKNSKKTNVEILENQWIRKPYGNFGLTLETPWELQASGEELPLDGAVTALIEKMETFENSSEDFRVMVNTIKYKPEIGQLDFRGGADGSISGMKNNPGVTNFIYKEDPFSTNNIPGVIQRGSYTQDSFDIEFINILLMSELNAWQVSFFMKRKDEVAKQVADRIIQSITIES